jgi:hypothetical protein
VKPEKKKRTGRGVLEFALPEQRDEFRMAQAATPAFFALGNIAGELRSKTKYGDLPPGELKAYEEIKKFFWQTVNDYEITEFV